MLVDGVEAASGVANRFRADLTSVCSGGTCAFSANLSLSMLPNLAHTVQVQAQNFMTGEWFNLVGTPKTLTCVEPGTVTPAQPPTPTQTPISMPVATATPTLTPTQPGLIGISLTVEHSQLIYFGPMLGQPAQRLFGELRGGSEPYEVILSVRSPAGLTVGYRLSSSGSFSLDMGSSGDAFFGTRETGTWTAWAVGVDDSGRTGTSPVVTWEVSWWPVHGRP